MLLRFSLGLRVLRLLSFGMFARMLLKLFAAMPMVSNVLGVLMIVLYIYAIVGARPDAALPIPTPRSPSGAPCARRLTLPPRLATRARAPLSCQG